MPQAEEITYRAPVNSIGTLAWQNAIINRTTSTPPGSPAIGDRYIVGPSPTGAWSGKVDNITQWTGTSWVLFAPSNGQVVFSVADNAWYDYTGTKWVVHESVNEEAVLTSADVNLKTLASVSVPVPAGAVFYPNTCGVIVTAAVSVTGYPAVEFGDDLVGATYYLDPSLCPNLNGSWSRQDFPALKTQQGTIGTHAVTANVTTIGTGTTLTGRFYWRGIMIQQ